MAQYNLEVQTASFGDDGNANRAGWVLAAYIMDNTTREFTAVEPCYVQIGTGLPYGSFIDKPIIPTEENRAVVRSEDLTSWVIVEDYRGRTVYNKTTLNPHLITSLGGLPDTLTTKKPSDIYDVWNEEEGNWVRDELAYKEALRQEWVVKIRDIIADCSETITYLNSIITFSKDEDEVAQAKVDCEYWQEYKLDVSKVDISDVTNVKMPVNKSTYVMPETARG